jgi:hypothetical protein
MFAGYYQLLGSNIERDRDFEDLVRHHWGFAEVSDILDDMKNKFAMVGLAYAFRHSLENGHAPEMSLEAFSDAVGLVGMHYSRADMRRVFNAFGDPRDSRSSLEVLRFTQHLTSAPRPPTPIPFLAGTAHFSEVNSLNSQSETGEFANHFMQYGQTASPSRASNSFGTFGPGFGARYPIAEDSDPLPPIVPAPPEYKVFSLGGHFHDYHHALPKAPPEHEDTDGPTAPPEGHFGFRDLPPMAPPEDDHDGDLAPEETDTRSLGQFEDSEPSPAPAD